ncbi:MAG: ribbon-helix-helix domain-containing protein [Candidatus Thermoplasmatota archaeon]|nr:ribbon-helix-helix domain-containing protein [Candidatus Thermoplasmatota archaeon]
MNISVEVTGTLLKYLDSKVKEGLYKSRSEAVRSAIREMIQDDISEQLKKKGVTPKELKKMRREIAGDILDKKFKDKTT